MIKHLPGRSLGIIDRTMRLIGRVSGLQRLFRRSNPARAHRRPASRTPVMLALTLTLGLGGTSGVQAQADPPRRQSISPTGVNYRSGAFSIDNVDLTAAGGFPGGISVSRSYNSGTDFGFEPYLAEGWTNNLTIYLRISALPRNPTIDYPQGFQDECIYNVVGGPRAVGFAYAGGERTILQTGCGPYVGTYVPIHASGAILEYVLENSVYHYRLTAADGSVLNFNSWSLPRATDWTFPDGTRVDFYYQNSKLQSVYTNRGWAVIFESANKTCLVNTAQTYFSPGGSCPVNAQSVTYSYAPGIYHTSWSLLTGATIDGQTTNYLYSATDDHINCIKDPGQSACKISNTYFNCAKVDQQFLANRIPDPVTSQLDGSGRTISYSYATNYCDWSVNDPNPDTRSFEGNSATVTETGVPGTSLFGTDSAGNLGGFTDPLGRSTSFYAQDPLQITGYPDLIESGEYDGMIYPEGNRFDQYNRDSRGNILTATKTPKSGSGLSPETTASSYPASCTNVKTCNRPSSVTDARGNQTDYTYDPSHGGVLTETGPAVNGVRPQKRYSYAQRYAWLKNSGGTYSQAATPVWVLTQESFCRTSAWTGSACAAGSTDEVVTSYDYGPNSGPNNLLLRGKTVTADGVTRRSCFSYDAFGRKISETSPNANLSVCP